MYEFDDRKIEEVMSQDMAVLEALARVDQGLFDSPEERDEDLDVLYENRQRVRKH